jgi:hypothetical protein
MEGLPIIGPICHSFEESFQATAKVKLSEYKRWEVELTAGEYQGSQSF